MGKEGKTYTEENLEVRFKAEQVKKLIEPLSKEEIQNFMAEVAARDPQLLNQVRAWTDNHVFYRKLHISGLSRNTTTETLKEVFSAYGEVEECRVLVDEHLGRSMGQAFVTYKDKKAAERALKNPYKKIDYQMVGCQLGSPPSERVDSSTGDQKEIHSKPGPTAFKPVGISSTHHSSVPFGGVNSTSLPHPTFGTVLSINHGSGNLEVTPMFNQVPANFGVVQGFNNTANFGVVPGFNQATLNFGIHPFHGHPYGAPMAHPPPTVDFFGPLHQPPHGSYQPVWPWSASYLHELPLGTNLQLAQPSSASPALPTDLQLIQPASASQTSSFPDGASTGGTMLTKIQDKS